MGTILRARLMCSRVTLESRDVADLALLLEAREGFHGGVEGAGGIGNVELIDVDAVEAEAFEAAFDGFFNVRGAGVVLPDAGSVARPADLGGDDQVFGIGIERFGDQFFRDDWGRRSRRCR